MPFDPLELHKFWNYLDLFFELSGVAFRLFPHYGGLLVNFPNVNELYFFEFYQRFAKELDGVNKQLAAAKKDLDVETMRRVDLENKVKTLQEEMTFKDQVHRKASISVLFFEEDVLETLWVACS